MAIKRRSSRKRVSRKPVKRRVTKKRPARRKVVSRPRPEVYSFKQHFPARMLGYTAHQVYDEATDQTGTEFRPQTFTRDPVTNEADNKPSNVAEGDGTVCQMLPPPCAGYGPYQVRGNSFYLRSLTGKLTVDYGAVQALPYDFPYRVIAGWWKPSRFMSLLQESRAEAPGITGETNSREMLAWFLQCGRGIRTSTGIETDSWYKGPDIRKTQNLSSHLKRATEDTIGQPANGLMQDVGVVADHYVDTGKSRMFNNISRFKDVVEICYDKVTIKHGKQTAAAQDFSQLSGPQTVFHTKADDTPDDPSKPTDDRTINTLGGQTIPTQTVRAPDVHKINWAKGGRYCKVATFSNVGPMTWNNEALISYDGNHVEVSKKNIAVTDAPNNWDVEQPIPFVLTHFPNQSFLDQRDLTEKGIYNEPAPRGPDYVDSSGATVSPPAWCWYDPYTQDGNEVPGGTALGGLACFQPLVKLETRMSYNDN